MLWVVAELGWECLFLFGVLGGSGLGVFPHLVHCHPWSEVFKVLLCPVLGLVGREVKRGCGEVGFRVCSFPPLEDLVRGLAVLWAPPPSLCCRWCG